MRRSRGGNIAWLIATGVLLGADQPPKPATGRPDLVLKGGTVVDGTGAAARRSDVAIKGDRIVSVGEVASPPGTKVVDVTGWIVAPGFIDLHTHSDEVILKPKLRVNLNYQTQGVTTIVTGNCGGGVLDAARYLAAINEHGAGTNVVHLIPHGTLRKKILGTADRAPRADELERMKVILEHGMEAGAWGISTGLIYVPGRFAETDELIALAKVVAKHGGLYATHMRDEGDELLDSIGETFAIGRGAGVPVHISHLKANGRTAWGSSGRACDVIEKARRSGLAVSADQYPYTASSTQLASMVIPAWALRGTAADFARIAADPAAGVKLREEILRALDRHDGGASIRIARYAARAPRVGLDLVAIAQNEGTTPLEIVLDIQRNGGAQAISFGMSEDDVREIMHHDFVATASDGSAHLPNSGDRPHPRGYGTFPRKIRYALDEKVISLEQAIRSCSGLPAEILRLADRGFIREGAVADLVVFDPKTFRDQSTYEQPTRYAAGVQYLFVNGVATIERGKPRNVLPGRALRLASDGLSRSGEKGLPRTAQ